jgi:hypothetical protein
MYISQEILRQVAESILECGSTPWGTSIEVMALDELSESSRPAAQIILRNGCKTLRLQTRQSFTEAIAPHMATFFGLNAKRNYLYSDQVKVARIQAVATRPASRVISLTWLHWRA